MSGIFTGPSKTSGIHRKPASASVPEKRNPIIGTLRDDATSLFALVSVVALIAWMVLKR